MTKALDVRVGSRFGDWCVVREESPDRRGLVYLCACKCGSTRLWSASRLGRVTCCLECSATARRALPPDSIRAGQKFGDWEVVSAVSLKDRNGVLSRRCLCRGCNTEHVVRDVSLASGKSLRCVACSNRVKAKKNKVDAEVRHSTSIQIGQRFGNWEILDNELHRCGVEYARMCACRCDTCDCNKKQLVNERSLTGGRSFACFSCARHTAAKTRKTNTESRLSEGLRKGERFGQWVTSDGVIYRTDSGRTARLCVCEGCSREQLVQDKYLKSGASTCCARCGRGDVYVNLGGNQVSAVDLALELGVASGTVVAWSHKGLTGAEMLNRAAKIKAVSSKERRED